MIAGRPGYRVGLAGANSLMGQELLRLLKERDFPVAHLAMFEAEEGEPDLPLIDLSEDLGFAETREEIQPGDLDVLFLAARARSKTDESSLLGRALKAAGLAEVSTPPRQPTCVVIDSADALGDVPGGTLSIPSLEKAGRFARMPTTTHFASPHPATIVISALLLRLADRFQPKRCVAQVYIPASEMGPRAIEELQKQTVNLLSFQKIPQRVFGQQLAFNVLSRLPGKHASDVCELETRIRHQVRQYLCDRAPIPALQFCQVPVFYSLAFSVFVELGETPKAEAVSAALEGGPITVRRRNEAAPSPVEAAGSGEILVDAVTLDPDHLGGCWIWAAVDNIRLAAQNAADIAESNLLQHHPKQ